MLKIAIKAIDIKLCYRVKKLYYPPIATQHVSTITFLLFDRPATFI